MQTGRLVPSQALTCLHGGSCLLSLEGATKTASGYGVTKHQTPTLRAGAFAPPIHSCSLLPCCWTSLRAAITARYRVCLRRVQVGAAGRTQYPYCSSRCIHGVRKTQLVYPQGVHVSPWWRGVVAWNMSLGTCSADRRRRASSPLCVALDYSKKNSKLSLWLLPLPCLLLSSTSSMSPPSHPYTLSCARDHRNIFSGAALCSKADVACVLLWRIAYVRWMRLSAAKKEGKAADAISRRAADMTAASSLAAGRHASEGRPPYGVTCALMNSGTEEGRALKQQKVVGFRRHAVCCPAGRRVLITFCSFV